MRVDILEFVEGAKNARGVTVIIDVFRAFSVACYVYNCGASQLIVTDDIDKAFKLRKIYPDSILVGERDEKKIPGFDFGNSPNEITNANIYSKVVIQTTTAGTFGIVNAVNADVIITGSIVNAEAIIRYIRNLKPEIVSLVAMGYRAEYSTEEDLLCAEIIEAGLKNRNENFDRRITELQKSSGKRFFNPNNAQFSPPEDFFLCTIKNRFNFVIRAYSRNDGNYDMKRIDT